MTDREIRDFSGASSFTIAVCRTVRIATKEKTIRHARDVHVSMITVQGKTENVSFATKLDMQQQFVAIKVKSQSQGSSNSRS